MAFITSEHRRRWPGGCVVWRFHDGLSDEEKQRFREAMDHWKERAGVRFVERSTQDSFVTYMPDDHINNVSNSNSLGMQGGEQLIRLEPIIDGSNSRTGTTRHEIGHAIGFAHEHKRCDRNDFVLVSSNIKAEREHDFERLCDNGTEEVGDYDFNSVMHYGAASNATTDGTPALRGTNAANQALFDGRTRGRVSPGDAAGAAKLHGGNAHVYQLSANGQIEKTVRQYSWTGGWTTATPFQMDVRNFMLFLKKSNGTMHLNSVNFDGTIGDRVQTDDWTDGWTTAIKYAIGPFNYFLFYKRGNGSVHVNDINADGTVGRRKFDENIEVGWTHIRHYAVGLNNFLFCYNAGTGEARVRNINWDGAVGGSPQAWTGSPGWTCVEPYSAGGRNYLFRLKASTGKMSIRRIRDDGTISSDDTDSRDWTEGWTMAVPYGVGVSTYLLLLKSGTGRLDICRLDGDGTIGATTDKREFGAGWTVGSVYHVGIGTFLILIKT